MRKFQLAIAAMLLLPSLTASSLPLTESVRTPSARKIYVSLVRKNSVTHYYNRLATQDSQLVVTKQPVDNPLATKELSLDADSRLILVELQGPVADAFSGELLRFANIAVVNIPAQANIHDFEIEKAYVEEIGTDEIQAPPTSKIQDLATSLTDEFASSIVIEKSYLEDKLKQFSGASAALIGGNSVTISERGSKKGKDNARAFLKSEYEAIGFNVTLEQFGTGSNPGINFVAEKPGTDPSHVVLLTSHMDSVSNAGADDNGSGTIGALAIAKALKDKTLRNTLRIVAFDQEEDGLVGSAAYAKSLNTKGTIKQLVGVLNLEMTGYDADDDGAFHVIDCNEGTSATLSAAIMNVVNRDPLRLKRVAACTNRSDHASFWKYNAPAVVISQNFFGGDDNPSYHKSCDKVDRVQFDYMTRLTTAVGRAVEDLLNVEIKL